jgi:hypothetical protein
MASLLSRSFAFHTGGVGSYIRFGFKVGTKYSDSGVNFLIVEIKLRKWVVLVATIYIIQADVGDYGLQAVDEICLTLLPLYGELSSWRF